MTTTYVDIWSLPCCRYVNQPQPELQGSSVTLKATDDRIQHMHKEADQIWPPELAQLMKVWSRWHHTLGDILLLVFWGFVHAVVSQLDTCQAPV